MAQPRHSSSSDLTITPCDEKSFDEIRSQQLKQKATECGDLPKVEEDVETTSSVQSNSNLVDWTGEDDRQNPKNFSIFRKVSVGIVISMMNLTVSMAASVFSAMLYVVAAEFKQEHPEQLESLLTAYLLGLAIGPVFFGPASDYYGRKRPLIIGMSGFMLFCTFTTYVNNVQALLMCRFMAAACGSAAYIIPPGMFVNVSGPVGRAIGYQLFATAAFIGGSLGPVIAACMLHHGINWRWTLYLINGVTFPLIVATVFLPETLEPVILQKKARRLRLATGDWALHAREEELPVKLSSDLVKPWKMLVQEPVLIVVTTAFTIDSFIQRALLIRKCPMLTP